MIHARRLRLEHAHTFPSGHRALLALALLVGACSSSDSSGNSKPVPAVRGTGASGSANGGSAATAGSSTGAAGTSTGAPRTAARRPPARRDPTEITRVSTWLTDKTSGLPDYAYTNIQKYFGTKAKFDDLACSIAASCAAFAPKEANWLVYCEAVVTSGIVAESS